MMNDKDFKSNPLWSYTEEINLEPNETQTITLPKSIKSAASSFFFTQRVKKNEASEYKFIVKSSINCKIKYKSNVLKKENFTILFNRDIVEEDEYFTNESILELQGNDIDEITLKIKNNSTTDNLIINRMDIFESDDVKVTTIAKVLKEETIAADLIQATSVFTDAIFTQILQTNAMSRSVRLAQSGQRVDYIEAEDNTLGFYTAILGSDQEQFTISTTKAGHQVSYAYWYAIIDGLDAYKYLTTIDPREKYPNISDSDRDAFRFMVYKPESIQKKMSIEFNPDENGNIIPSMIWGAGSVAENQNNGKGFIYKNLNGFYHIYCQSNGNNVGIVMDEDGVHITGWADQHCESIIFKDNGVKIKFVGENLHNFEYVFDDDGELTGILQDSQFLTSISYEAGNL